MEILRPWSILLILAATAASLAPAPAQTDMVLIPGLSAELVYDLADPATGGLGLPPWDLAIDPLTGDLYVAQSTTEGGSILGLSANGQFVRNIPFFSQALGFAPDDGTLYFGVSNLLLGTWQRQDDVFRQFATIPSVRGVQVTADGTLWVAEGDFGPQGLFPDTVLRVDRGDGFFEPVFLATQAEAQLGRPYEVMTALAVTSDHTIWAGFHTGELVRRTPEGNYSEHNRRFDFIGGLNEAPLAVDPDDVVYQHDLASGQIFAYIGDEVSLLAFGPSLRGIRFSNGGLASDGSSLYVVSDRLALIKISPSSGSIRHSLEADRGQAEIVGVVRDRGDGAPLAGVTVSLNTSFTMVTGEDGAFEFQIPAGLYEMRVAKTDFRAQVLNLVAEAEDQLQLEIELNPGLPEYLAPGLLAQILGNRSLDGIAGSSDISIDDQGRVYSMNFSSGDITEIETDPLSGERLSSRILASGGDLSNSFTVFAAANGLIYASSGNRGVLEIPRRADGATVVLEVDPSDQSRVIDQDGINRIVSRVSDVDGITQWTTGELIFTSGTSGSPTPGFPDGTFNTLVGHAANGDEFIQSRGIPAAGGDPLWVNCDQIYVDPQDRLLVGDRQGNVIRVEKDGTAELIWPGSGEGKPDGLGAFSSLSDDGHGHLFVRGGTGDGSDAVLRMITPDGEGLITVAAGLSFDFGGIAWDDDGASVVVSDDNLVIRIRTANGRRIADELLQPAPVGPVEVEGLEIPGASVSHSLRFSTRSGRPAIVQPYRHVHERSPVR